MKRVILAAAFAAVWYAHADDALRRKYIGHGWDLLAVTPEEVLAHADEFDRTGLDGVSLMPRAKGKDGRLGHRLAPMSGTVWSRDDLKDRQRLSVDHADGEFAARDVLLDENGLRRGVSSFRADRLERVREGLLPLSSQPDQHRGKTHRLPFYSRSPVTHT